LNIGLYSSTLFFAGSESIAHTELIAYAAEGTYKSECRDIEESLHKNWEYS
jgi:hypothetical protein